jgi:hypothetical protein
MSLFIAKLRALCLIGVFCSSLLFSICIPLLGFAKEDAHGGEGAAKKEEPKAAPPEWMALQTDIQGLAAKIKAKQENLVRLFSSGHGPAAHGAAPPAGHAPAPPAAAGHASGGANQGAQEINKEHKELRELISEYEKKRTTLRYRFPEAGALSDRRYKRIELKSIEQYRNETGVEKKLRQASEKVKKVYGYQPEASNVNAAGKGSTKNDRLPASDAKQPIIYEKIPLLDEPIILKK